MISDLVLDTRPQTRYTFERRSKLESEIKLITQLVIRKRTPSRQPSGWRGRAGGPEMDQRLRGWLFRHDRRGMGADVSACNHMACGENLMHVFGPQFVVGVSS